MDINSWMLVNTPNKYSLSNIRSVWWVYMLIESLGNLAIIRVCFLALILPILHFANIKMLALNFVYVDAFRQSFLAYAMSQANWILQIFLLNPIVVSVSGHFYKTIQDKPISLVMKWIVADPLNESGWVIEIAYNYYIVLSFFHFHPPDGLHLVHSGMKPSSW
jgi:hypothetical protein